MPIDSKTVQELVATGVSYVCSMCERFHEGREKEMDRCTAVDGCGSPIVRDTFHEYVGPIRDFTQNCFVCGAPAKKGIRVTDHVRIVGVCDKHISYITGMAPTSGRRLPILDSAVFDAGTGKMLVRPKPEKTLSNLLAGVIEPDEK